MRLPLHPLSLFILLPCSYLGILAGRIHEEASTWQDLSTHDLIPEPTPDEFVASLDTVDFSQQPYALQMLAEGLEPMTAAQKVWSAEYFATQLPDGIASLPDSVVAAAPAAMRSLRLIPSLTEAALFDKAKFDAEVLSRLNDGIRGLSGHREVDEFVSLLGNLRDYFFMLMHFPRSHFYLGMTDTAAFKIGGEPALMQLPIEATRMMHPLNDDAARSKSDRRRDSAVILFECLYKAGVATQAIWNLDSMLENSDCSSDAIRRPLQSFAPLKAFPTEQEDGTAYVMMEGNGRTAGLKAAVDILNNRYADFVAPHLNVHVFTGTESESSLIKNLQFFLDLNWRTQFPDVELKGWRRQVPSSIRPVDDELLRAAIYERPRYFGYIPW